VPARVFVEEILRRDVGEGRTNALVLRSRTRVDTDGIGTRVPKDVFKRLASKARVNREETAPIFASAKTEKTYSGELYMNRHT